MFDRWTSDITEVKRAASELYCLVSAELEAGIKASTININILLVPTGALEMAPMPCILLLQSSPFT